MPLFNGYRQNDSQRGGFSSLRTYGAKVKKNFKEGIKQNVAYECVINYL